MPEFWLPRTFTGQRANYVCRLCSDRHYTPEALASHVRQCYRANEGEIRSQALREKAPGLFGDSGVDVEFESWHKQHGYRKAI